MKLLNEYILVKKIEEKDTSGFQVKSAINELIGKGEVYSLPEGISFPPVGSVAYFQKHIGTEFEIKGQKVKFVHIKDIMGYEENT